MTASVERVLERLGVAARLEGKRWWAERCPHPDHAAHNPAHAFKNMFVHANGTEKAGLWHCYSCKSGGRLIELVMALLALEGDDGFRSAIAWLRDVEEAPALAPVVRVRFQPIGYRAGRFQIPAEVEWSPLPEWNSVARRYAESRGIDAAQVERWRIGVAFEGRLSGRIVFPICDQGGAAVNYAARTFVGDETRYLAASEWERPDLSAMLGEHLWPGRAEELARSVLVVFEGAITGMAIERSLRRLQVARACVAGLQGSDIDNRRIAKFALFGAVVAATDPDSAGDKAAAMPWLSLTRKRIPFARVTYPDARDAADLDRDEPAVLDAAIGRALRDVAA